MITIFKFRFLNEKFGNTHFKLLDVGAGNNSASRTKKIFPNCEYYGLDMSRDYSNTDNDFALMTDFYEIDLTQLNYSIIPDNYFDAIQMSHVIEHLENGDEVLKAMAPKLKSGGYFYIEFPGMKSTKLPSMWGTLNFYDDPTHKRIYSVQEISSVLEQKNFAVLKSGTRRNWYYIVFMPVRIVQSLVKYKRLNANVFWDILGFAEFVFAKKN
jgi:ubiquinone/menaquinone biosynthesis C-methylase UbiE